MRRVLGAVSNHRPPAWALVAILSAVPIAISLVRLFTFPGSLVASGDVAITEIASRSAAGFDQLLGPYSRFGWHHPGPLYFYLQGAAHSLLDSTEALYATALLISYATGAAVVSTVWRRYGQTAGVTAAAISGALALMFNLGFLRFPWTPHVLVFPTFGFLVWCGLAGRSRLALCLAAVSGSLIAQTHVSTVPLFIVGIVTAVVLFIVTQRSDKRRLLRGLIACSGLLVLCWLPVIIEQFTATTGNITRLMEYSSQSVVSHSWTETIGRVGQSLWNPLNETPNPSRSVVPMIVFVLLCTSTLVVGRRSAATVVTTALALVAAASSVVLLRTTDGVLWHYLSIWMPAAPFAVLAVLTCALFQRVPQRPARVASYALAACAFLALTVQTYTASPLVSDTAVTRLASGVLTSPEVAPSRADGLVRVDIRSGSAWAMATGITNELERRGFAVDTRAGGNEDNFGLPSRNGPATANVGLWAKADYETQRPPGTPFESHDFVAVVSR